MILKLLLVMAVVGVIYFMFIKKKPTKEFSKQKPTKKRKIQSNEMVECSACGIYAELEDSIISNNRYYCSDECVGKA